ncbi:MAG TPA: 16S rRNA (cytosine(1402)-N(4))-methyltransferase RsmH [Beijerinckiaceae bacterium]|jgi:16S rRNA (cytosine1402-N4)-methyltransferase|nr:16S rRNA (cytosine(1402)-N(4))-methyltransferase RsmH [Beijerinckiaceae bacterium]
MMSDRGDDKRLAAGGPARHVPVLLDAVLRALDLHAGFYLDATFGAGGYTRAMLEQGAGTVLALDRDPQAIAAGVFLAEAFPGQLILEQARFGHLDLIAARHGLANFDGIVLDLGVSSMQLDAPGRGFSFRFDGPLDMRMGQEGQTAADLVNGADVEQLADILYHYGEERQSRRIARAIVHDRFSKPFLTTRDLAELVARLMPARPMDIHPATRTFQALRIAVNDELGELVRALVAAERILKPGGKLVVVSFHSLEDRIVKQFLAKRSGRGVSRSRLLPGEPAAAPVTFEIVGRQPVLPNEAEVRANPRARSAKLRVATRTSASARDVEAELIELADLPHRTTKGR